MTIGNIYEIETKKGKGYLQFVKAASSNKELEKVKVFYDLYPKKPEKLQDIIDKDGFFLEFALKTAIRMKLVNFIGKIPLSNDFAYPRYFRSENVFGSGWRIIDSKGGQKMVENLDDDQIKLSPWGVWNVTLLVENLENGWRLENWV